MSDTQLLSHAVSNIFAGSDTTAASLRSVFYYLCRTPSAHQKLLDEIDKADAAGKLSRPVTFAEAQNLPYLQAVIKEALRMHPAVGLLLERVVPEGGAGWRCVAARWYHCGNVSLLGKPRIIELVLCEVCIANFVAVIRGWWREIGQCMAMMLTHTGRRDGWKRMSRR